MPELPEVQTTVNGINAELKGLKITDVWTDYKSSYHAGKRNIKNPKYFKEFKKEVVDGKILNATRKGKNILIHLSNHETILIHMKMTGHLLYGKYHFTGTTWRPVSKTSTLNDPYSKYVHLIFILSNKKHLAFSDLRRFAKVLALPTSEVDHFSDLKKIGPDPLSQTFTFKKFCECLAKKPNGRIKPVLMDQSVIAGIGNIYSDEILWQSGVHPESKPIKIPEASLKKIYRNSKIILKKGIAFGGDSDSDYRNIYGQKGAFQHKHNAYRRTGKPCPKKDGGIIERKMIAGRSAHFCPVHQILFK